MLLGQCAWPDLGDVSSLAAYVSMVFLFTWDVQRNIWVERVGKRRMPCISFRYNLHSLKIEFFSFLQCIFVIHFCEKLTAKCLKSSDSYPLEFCNLFNLFSKQFNSVLQEELFNETWLLYTLNSCKNFNFKIIYFGFFAPVSPRGLEKIIVENNLLHRAVWVMTCWTPLDFLESDSLILITRWRQNFQTLFNEYLCEIKTIFKTHCASACE